MKNACKMTEHQTSAASLALEKDAALRVPSLFQSWTENGWSCLRNRSAP